MVVLTDVPHAASRPPSGADRTPAPGDGLPETPAPDDHLPDALRERCAAVIDVELTRLARRTSLGGEELAVVAGALHRLTDSLLLERVRAVHCAPSLLAALFDLEKTC